jgi:hypothetical protein
MYKTTIVPQWQYLLFLCIQHPFQVLATVWSTALAFSEDKISSFYTCSYTVKPRIIFYHIAPPLFGIVNCAWSMDPEVLNQSHNEIKITWLKNKIMPTHRSKSREHISHILWDETAKLQKILFAEAQGFIFSFSALQLTVKCSTKILIHQWPATTHKLNSTILWDVTQKLTVTEWRSTSRLFHTSWLLV